MTENQHNKNKPGGLSVLITGGSGLVGKYLTSLLLSEGFNVAHLSRNANQFGKVRVYRWHPEMKIIDPLIFEGVDYIIHLAGANIGERRWSEKRREEIVSSRIDSARLLFESVNDNGIKLKAFISASAIGYYGSVTSNYVFHEYDPPAKDFLGTTCRQWEETANLFSGIGVRTVNIRSAVVLEKNENVLARFLKPARLGIFPRLGTGAQYMSWIHIQDLCNIYLKAIKDDRMQGAYNAASAHQVTQMDFIRTLAKTMHKPFFVVPVPSIILRAVFGEMSDIILKGSRVSSEKIISSGFRFIYSDLEIALKNAIGT